jgi:type IV pilus assembly protein PilW
LLDAALAADTVVAVDKEDCGTPALGGVGSAIEGYQIGEDVLPGDLANFFTAHKISPLTGTDLIRVSSGTELGIDIDFDPAGKNNLDDPNASLQISACEALYAGQVVIAVTLDGTRASRFMVSACNPGTKKSELLHRPNQEITGVGVKNCDHRLQADFSGGYLVGFDSSVYFVAMTSRGVPALYRSINFGTPEEMVEGVEDMQVQFGVGADSTRVAENYRPAVDIWTPVDTDAAWDNVRSVRLQLLLQSPDANILQTANPIEFSPPDFVAWNKDDYTDGRWRQVYSTTIAVRNRVP